MTEKTIPLKDVRNALMCAVVRQRVLPRVLSDGKPMARFAAYTRYPTPFSPDCRHARRSANLPPHLNFGPLTRGDMEWLLEKVRWNGLAEVRRTFGVGMRALQAEFAQGAMR